MAPQDPPKPTPEPDPGVETIYITPPSHAEATAPPFANQVRVIGGADAMVLQFYFVSPGQMLKASLGEQIPNMKRQGNELHVESMPVARVAIPFTVAAALMAALAETTSGGVEMIQEAVSNFVMRTNEIAEKSG